jgi:FkbM family methyltransferase
MMNFARSLLIAAAVTAPRAFAANCSANLRRRHYDVFQAHGGIKATACPAGNHFVEYANSTCAQKQHASTGAKSAALVIGGNTGSDCVGLLMFLSGLAEVGIGAWIDVVNSVEPQHYPRPNCPHADYPRLHHNQPEAAHVYCVEPLPRSYKTIAAAAAMSPFRGKLTAIHAAASDVVPEGGTVPFTNHDRFGKEQSHIDYEAPSSVQGTLKLTEPPHKKISKPGKSAGRKHKKETFVNVVATTVDTLVENELGGVPPLVLSIDTEGFDGLVLKGARRTLRSGGVGLLAFEFHGNGPWAHMRLSDTVAELDELGYECYWAHFQGLLPLTCFDWNAFGNEHKWSNLVCAARSNECWSKALERAVLQEAGGFSGRT